MNKSRKACCIDTNILFDFITGNVFDRLLLLPYKFHTLDIMLEEISGTYSAEDLKQFGFEIIGLDGDEVRQIDSLKRECIALSLEDVAVYFMSLKYRMMMLSNDGPLRELAESSHIEYHGTLWLLNELIQRDLLTPDEAAAALKSMLKKKRWLPRPECEALIKKWESEK